MTKVGIMQPYFFPYLGYWQLINAVDRYVVYDDVTYIKGGWINRNNILLEGKAHLITLPLKSASSFKKINDINIVEKSIEKILKTIKAAYSKAPYYNQIMPMVENLFTENSNIALFNYNSVIKICDYLDVKTEIILSSDIEKDNSLRGQTKVIHINKILGGNIYINAIGGQKLYNKNDFKQENIELKFLQMNDIKYKQFNNNFIPCLSIIDVLMFNNKNEIKQLLNEFNLK